MRRFDPNRDFNSALELINADRLLGQPNCTQDMLRDALAGNANVDRELWDELAEIETWVAEADNQISSIVSAARQTTEGVGQILWAHARENKAALVSAFSFAARELAQPVIRAFSFATPLTAGLEGLPARHRASTVGALEGLGFATFDLWSYMRLERLGLRPGIDTFAVEVEREGSGWKLSLRDQKTEVGFASIGLLRSVGVVWYLHVSEAHRRGGIGHRLMTRAIDLLRQQGASDVILYVDDDDVGGPRDRSGAKQLYQKLGFHEVDRLYSFERGPS